MKLTFTTKTGRATAGPWNLTFLFSDLILRCIFEIVTSPCKLLYFQGHSGYFGRGIKDLSFMSKR